MPLSKQKLKQIAVSLPNGVLSNGISESGVREVNRLVEKIHGALFPKGQSVVLEQVWNRIMAAAATVPIIWDAANDVNQNRVQCVGNDAIPLSTIKKMIREYAGNVKVEDNVLLLLCPILSRIVSNIMLASAEQIKDGVAILDGKHVKAALSAGNLRDLAAALLNVKAKRRSSSGKRRSSSKKRRSSSRKRCPRGKSPVRAFKRDDGVRVKAYCRKS